LTPKRIANFAKNPGSLGKFCAFFRNGTGADFSREAAAADSRGRQPTGKRPYETPSSREAATAIRTTICCRRFAACVFV
jgi:hypothetical protein